MHPIIHLIVGIAVVLILGIKGTPALIFILASALIDLDHLTDLPSKPKIQKEHIWSFHKYQDLNYQNRQKSLHFFHTFEVLLLSFVLSIYYPVLFYFASAILLHLALDGWGNVWNRNIKKKGKKGWVKYWFLIYYIKKCSILNKENF